MEMEWSGIVQQMAPIKKMVILMKIGMEWPKMNETIGPIVFNKLN